MVKAAQAAEEEEQSESESDGAEGWGRLTAVAAALKPTVGRCRSTPA